MTPRRVACSPCLGPALSVVQVLAPVVVLCDPPARLRSPRSRGAVDPVGLVTVADAVFEWAERPTRCCSVARGSESVVRTTLLKINL